MKLDTVREDKAIQNVTSRLAETFAEIHQPETINHAVQTAHQQFAGDPVREYVPILVERIVRKELTPAPPAAPRPEPHSARVARWTAAGTTTNTNQTTEEDPTTASPRPTTTAAAAPNPSRQTSEPAGEQAAVGTDTDKPVAGSAPSHPTPTTDASRQASEPAGKHAAEPAERSTTSTPRTEASRQASEAAGVVGAGTEASTRSSAPVVGDEGSRRASEVGRSRRVAVPAAVAGVLVVAAVVAVGVVQGRDEKPVVASLTSVRAVIGSEKRPFFEDPAVQAALAKHGLEVKVDTAGSRQIATSVDVGKYDLAFPSSAPAAERILQPSESRAGITAKKYAAFSSPMAIATYQPIVDLLAKEGIARQVNGVWTFDVAQYLAIAARQTRWDQLGGNPTYPVRKRVLVTTTDPRTSNSAAMFLSILSYVANGNNVVQGAAAEQRVLKRVAPLFVDQGFTDSSSEGPFEDYLALGMGKSPMVCVYEAQFVGAAVQGRIKPGMVLIYPSPTVLSKHTVLAITPAGERIGQLLSTDPELQQLAAQHGFRTADQDQFAKVVAQHKVRAAEEVLDVADAPTYDTLEHLLDGVSKSYR